MLSLNTTTSITSLITLLLAYLLAVGPMGFFNAWVGKMVGDYTAEDRGLLTLDPFVHLDPIGLICMLFCGIGWSKGVPINMSMITAPFRNLKIAFALFGETVLGLGLALAGLLLSIISGLHPATATMEANSSLLFAFQSVLVTFVFLVLFFAVARFLYGILLLAIIMLSKNYQSYATLLSELSFVILFILIIFFGRHLQSFCVYGLLWVCALIGQVTGLLN